MKNISFRIDKSIINEFLAILNNNFVDYDFVKTTNNDLIDDEYYIVLIDENKLEIVECDEDFVCCPKCYIL